MKIIIPMAFAHVPIESKSQIKKAGQILSKDQSTITIEEFQWAFDLVTRWRACHAYPINTFQATLRTKLKNHYIDYIVAQRLKRLPTIINKLSRFPNMKLDTMQDIGGIRAILKSIDNVYKLKDEYCGSPYFNQLIVDRKDYIDCPRNEDGYRGVHLVFKYKNQSNPRYDGLRVEMQIRTKLQHAWATAVETMGTFLGQALKSRQGDAKWLDFFALTSSAFAIKEKCPKVPRFAHFNNKDTFKAVANAEANLGALEKMRGFSMAINAIHTDIGKGKGSSYYLVVLDSLNHHVSVKPYDRDSFSKAIADYSEIELEVTKGKNVEPVLVSSGSINSLKSAYPNFFLDTSEFSKILADIIEQSKK